MKKSVKIFWRIFLIGFAAFILFLVLINFGVFGKMPSLEELENPSVLQASEVLAADGTLMGKYYVENGNRSIAKYRDISPHIINALIATEDKRFYDHSGIDLKGTSRAVFLLGTQGGGSTITQQLALALFNKRAKGKVERVVQKLKEWIIAVKLERNFTKEEIIALYLNAIPFSDNVYGIRNASRTFFKKEPDRLTVEEAALLVGMINGPGIFNPRVHPKESMERRNLVISRMAENGNISPGEATKLKAIPIKLNYSKLDENTGYAPYFREVLRDEVKEMLKDIKKPDGSSYNIYKDGLRIITTINPRMQQYAEEAVASHMPVLQRSMNTQANIKNGNIWKDHENVLEAQMKASDRWREMDEQDVPEKEIRASFFKKTPMKVFAWNANNEKDTVMTPYDSIKYHRQMVQASFMVTDPTTGEVRAWVGGINFKTYKFDHANLKTKRQVGSTIKPLLYTQAMEERGFNPDTEVQDVQQDFGRNRLVPATSRTCSGRTMTMASALAWSKNCATAYIMKQVGPEQFAEFLGRLNLPTKVDPNPSIALGACELSLFEMMWGYSIFAGRGYSTKPFFITRIEDHNGNVLKRFDFSSNRREAVSEITAYKMARMMQGTVDIGTARGLRTRLGASEMGGKTGTTNNNSDAWYMGYTPQLLGGIWTGNDDRFIRNESTAVSGAAAARPIWEAFFKKVYGDKTLGIDKDALFSVPANFETTVGTADFMPVDTTVDPSAQGDNLGVGSEEDYYMEGYSDEKKKDNKTDKKDTTSKPIRREEHE
jgi:penicillin-binding protein 1A